jgi:hypothetical protein
MIGPSKVVSEGDDEKMLPSSSTTQMYVVSLAIGGAPLAARVTSPGGGMPGHARTLSIIRRRSSA